MCWYGRWWFRGRARQPRLRRLCAGFGAIDGHGSVARPDLVIVARGGGSVEDLWSFNEEEVVRAIADCPIPIISAVGHETDTTLADFAADMRAPTPTAAAEMAVPVRADLIATLADLAHRQKRNAMRPVTLGRERLTARVGRMPRPETLLQPQAQRLDDLADRLKRGLSDRVVRARQQLAADRAHLSAPLLRLRLDRARDRLTNTRLSPKLLERPMAQRQARLAALTRLAEQLHPEKPLERGYVLARDGSGKVVTSAKLAARADALELKFRDGPLGVVPIGTGGATPSSPRRKAKSPARPAKPATPARQDDLFG